MNEPCPQSMEHDSGQTLTLGWTARTCPAAQRVTHQTSSLAVSTPAPHHHASALRQFTSVFPILASLTTPRTTPLVALLGLCGRAAHVTQQQSQRRALRSYAQTKGRTAHSLPARRVVPAQLVRVSPPSARSRSPCLVSCTHGAAYELEVESEPDGIPVRSRTSQHPSGTFHDTKPEERSSSLTCQAQANHTLDVVAPPAELQAQGNCHAPFSIHSNAHPSTHNVQQVKRVLCGIARQPNDLVLVGKRIVGLGKELPVNPSN